MRQLSEAEAVAFHDSKAWESLTLEQRAHFQMAQDRLCMPFRVFHEAIEKTLGRPVWTHEFANRDRITQEFLDFREAPTLEEIMEMIPAEKRVVLEL